MKNLYRTGLEMVYNTFSGISCLGLSFEAPHSIARKPVKYISAIVPRKKEENMDFGDFVKTHSRKITKIFCVSFFK